MGEKRPSVAQPAFAFALGFAEHVPVVLPITFNRAQAQQIVPLRNEVQ